MKRERFTRGRVLVFAVFLLLIVLGYYFGLLKTPIAAWWNVTG